MAAEPSVPSGFGTRPWLVQATGGERQTFVDSLDGSLHSTIVPEMQGNPHTSYLFHHCFPIRRFGSLLPLLPFPSPLLCVASSPPPPPPRLRPPLPLLHELSDDVTRCATLGTSPAHPDYAVVVAVAREVEDGVERFLLHCRPGDSQWARLESPKITAPCLMIGYRGKIYSFEVHDGPPMYYIVESCGDLFNVVTQFFGDFINDGTLTSVAVYRLDLESLTWTRVDSIGGDRAFLISGLYGFSVPGNCVYFVLSGCDCERLYKFCLDDNTTSFHQILPQPTEQPFWTVQANSWNTRPWHDLPLELLEPVVSRLSLVDRLRFPAVCKSWSLVTNPVEQAIVWPWLLHSSGRDGACKLFDPLRSQEYNMHVETFDINQDEHDEHIFRFSKGGWVAMSTNADIQDMYIINPFTEEVVEMVMLDWEDNYMGLSWSSMDPKSPDCIFFAVNSRQDGKAVGALTWRHGEAEWFERHLEYYEGDPFPVAYNNPVLKGNLGTFDPASDTWTILEKSNPIHVEMDLEGDHHEGREFCYLVELRGELVSVFMRNADQPPRVFKLNEEEMAWMKVQEIGGAALFLDFRVSYSVASPEAGHGNRIYFPSYSEDGKQAAFYDMETKAYHPSFYGLKSPLQCVWVVPNLRPHNVSKKVLARTLPEGVPSDYI
ncbi:hypothetical protein VPH35_113058 [Triticum aestivum]